MTRAELVAYCVSTSVLFVLFWNDPVHLIALMLIMINGQLLLLRSAR